MGGDPPQPHSHSCPPSPPPDPYPVLGVQSEASKFWALHSLRSLRSLRPHSSPPPASGLCSWSGTCFLWTSACGHPSRPFPRPRPGDVLVQSSAPTAPGGRVGSSNEPDGARFQGPERREDLQVGWGLGPSLLLVQMPWPATRQGELLQPASPISQKTRDHKPQTHNPPVFLESFPLQDCGCWFSAVLEPPSAPTEPESPAAEPASSFIKNRGETGRGIMGEGLSPDPAA